MSSIRLPEKVLIDIAGRPMLWHVVNRTRGARLIERVVVATTTNKADDVIEQFCRQNRIDCFRGSEDDVLDRFYQAAKLYDADPVVRVTGDCPLIDPEIFDKVIAKYLEGGYEFVTNTLQYTYPDGLDLEMFSFAALERAWRETTEPRHREHVGSFIRYSGLFPSANVENETDLLGEEHRWTVDDARDLEFVREVFARLGGSGDSDFGMNEVLSLVNAHPEIRSINQGAIRNEGAYLSFAKGPAVPPQQRDLSRSLDMAAEARGLLSGYADSVGGHAGRLVQGTAPVILSRGEGSHVWDLDGNEYIDFSMADVILGHNYQTVTEAVCRQVKDGNTFSQTHPLALEVAQMLVDVIPCAEMVSFYRSGPEASLRAIEAAHAYTGKSAMAYCGDKSRHNQSTVLSGNGIGKASAFFEYNDTAGLERILDENRGRLAAIVMRSIDVIEPRGGFLEELRRTTERDGILLIFDETATAFRLAAGGAQEHFGVTPDLTFIGSAMANGYPIAALVGRREILERLERVRVSLTEVDAIALAAARATITCFRDRDVSVQLWAVGRRLKDGCAVLAREFEMAEYVELAGPAPRTVLSFKEELPTEPVLKRIFLHECSRRGLLTAGGNYLSYSHTNADIDQTLRVYRTVLEILQDAVKERNN